MDTTDVLRRKRAKLLGQIEFIDELLAEMPAADDSAPPAPEVVHPPALTRHGKPSPAEDARATPPKVVRPAAPKPAGKPSPVAAEYAERVADALLGGPLAATEIEKKAGISYPTVAKTLKGRPEWFTKTGRSVNTRWELTPEGRRAAGSRAASPSPPGGAA